MNRYNRKNFEFLLSTNRNPYLLVSRPKSLDIDTMLPPSLRHKIDEALYLISLLIFKTAHGMVDANGYTNLNFDILSKIMNNRTLRQIKGSLLANEVIQCDGIWIPDIKSLGYRLHPKFCNDTAITSIIKDRRTRRALDRYHVRKLAESEALWLPVHHELNKQKNLIEIDMDQANEAIQKLEPKVKRKPKAGSDPEQTTRRTKLAQSSLCQSIHNKSNALKVGTTRRVYNCVTSLSREIRPALRYKGEQLASVDIRNSQPALFSKLVEDHLASGNGNPSNLEAGSRKNASHIGTRRLDGCGLGRSLLGPTELDCGPQEHMEPDCDPLESAGLGYTGLGHTEQAHIAQERRSVGAKETRARGTYMACIFRMILFFTLN